MTDRLFTEDTLIIATHNAGKMREIKALFAGFGINILSAADLGLDEPDETETSFTGNALLKARTAAMRAGQPALADDSGLCVNALDGAPGIYSARWAGPDRDFSLAMTAVETALTNTGNSDQGAEFVCALALVWPDGDEVCVEGRVKGQITFPPRGIHGFGYDPIFQPDGHQISFGEMDPDAKHAMSHRADAFAQLLARCFGKADGI
ncbi:RdgB/HAM1 family non-canonical purine NTP pyrophosphatase [Alphaproteobacteria bacterium LSUCC0396]